MKFLIVNPSTLPILIRFGLEYSPHDLVLKYPYPVNVQRQFYKEFD